MRPVGRIAGQGGAEGQKRLASIEAGARTVHRPPLRGLAAEPVEEHRLPAQGLAALVQRRQAQAHQRLVGLGIAGRQAKARQQGLGQGCAIGLAEAVERGDQRLVLGQQGQAGGQLLQAPEHLAGLATIGIEAALVEIGRREAEVVARQEPIGAVVEALASEVQVVGVQHPVHEAGRHPGRGEPGQGLSGRLHQAYGPRRPLQGQEVGVIVFRHMVDQPGQVVGAAFIGVALEGPDADMAVRQAGQHRRAGGARFVMASQGLAGLEHGEGATGGNAQGLQHLGRQHLAHRALERQAPVAAARPGGAA